MSVSLTVVISQTVFVDFYSSGSVRDFCCCCCCCLFVVLFFFSSRYFFYYCYSVHLFIYLFIFLCSETPTNSATSIHRFLTLAECMLTSETRVFSDVDSDSFVLAAVKL